MSLDHITHHFNVNKARQNARQHMKDTVERLRTKTVAIDNRAREQNEGCKVFSGACFSVQRLSTNSILLKQTSI